jgi:hypothetical protein
MHSGAPAQQRGGGLARATATRRLRRGKAQARRSITSRCIRSANPEHRAGLAAGLTNTSQELGGALGLAVSASWAFRRVSELTRNAHGNPNLIEAARTTVFHDGFAVGAVLALLALLISLVLLPRIPHADRPVAA